MQILSHLANGSYLLKYIYTTDNPEYWLNKEVISSVSFIHPSIL